MTRVFFFSLLVVLVASPIRAQMLPVTTASEEARAHFELGRHAAFHYQNAQAQEHLDAAIAADPHFVLAYLHRGGMSTSLERGPYFEAARANRHRVTPAEQRMIDAFHAFLWDTEIPTAIEIFSELAEEYPDDPYLPSYIGLRYYWNLQQYEDAKAQFERALERDPTFAQAYNWLGYTALSQEAYEAAEAAFRRYLEMAPDQPRPYHSMGLLYLRLDQPEDAAEYFERSSKVDSRFSQGREALMRLRIQQANRELEAAIARRDAAAAAAAYAPGAEVWPPVGGGRRGASEIEAFWGEILGVGFSGVHLETVEVYVGDVGYAATEVGRYQLTGDADLDRSGTYIVIWARTADGWKRYRDLWTSE